MGNNTLRRICDTEYQTRNGRRRIIQAEQWYITDEKAFALRPPLATAELAALAIGHRLPPKDPRDE